MKRRSYELGHVVMRDEWMENAFMAGTNHLMSVDTDRLLAGYYMVAGMDVKVPGYDNAWENSETAGHLAGSFLVALSQAYLCTEDKEYAAQISYMLDELALCQKENGYLGARPEEAFFSSEYVKEQQMPWYATWQLLSGLIKTYRLLRDENALRLAVKLGRWVAAVMEKRDYEDIDPAERIGYGGMNGVMYELYDETGDEKFLDTAERFDDTALYRALAAGRDVLERYRVKMTTASLLGALTRYEVLGAKEILYLRAAVGFFDIVTERHMYLTGGSGEWELFGAGGMQHLSRTNCNCETCGSFYMAELAKRLYQITGQKKYMDFYERIFYNALLASSNPENGMTTFFQPMATGNFKVFGSVTEQGWCCTGTGLRIVTGMSDGIYSYDDGAIYVNLFTSSVLQDFDKRLLIEQVTSFPHTCTTEITIHAKEAKPTKLALRIPEWLSGEITVTKNDIPVEYTLTDGYAVLKTLLADGERYVVSLPAEIKMHTLPETRMVAFTFGPYVLAAGLGDEEMDTGVTGRGISVSLNREEVRYPITLHGQDVETWMEEVTEHLRKKEGQAAWSFDETAGDEGLLFVPYHRMYKECYGIYFKLSGIHRTKQKKLPLSQKLQKKRDKRRKTKELLQLAKAPKDIRQNTPKAIPWLLLTAAILLLAAVIELFIMLDASAREWFTDTFSFLQSSEQEEKPPEILFHFDNLQEAVTQYNQEQKGSFTASVEILDNEEYLCFTGADCRVFYKNRYAKDSEDYLPIVMIENGRQRASFVWDFSVRHSIAELCPQTGKYLQNGEKTVVCIFYESDATQHQTLHVVSHETLMEYQTAEALTEAEPLLVPEAFLATPTELMLSLRSGGAHYRVLLEKTENPAETYKLCPLAYTTYRTEDDRIIVTSYVKVGEEDYIGQMSGVMTLENGIVTGSGYSFSAYADSKQADTVWNAKPISWDRLLWERTQIVTETGERLLIPVQNAGE